MAPLEQREDMFEDDLIDDVAKQIPEDAEEELLEDDDADLNLNKKGRGADLEWKFFLQYDTLEVYNESAIKKELSDKYSLRKMSETLGSTRFKP